MMQVGLTIPTKTITRMSSESQGIQISFRELNSHFVCVLCFGYFVDATTITECMHTFCKSCIVNFLSTNHHCPHCDTLLSRTRTLNSLRSDRIMQALVYKTVPGLFQTEMRRRINFYQNQPDGQHILSDFKNDVEDLQNYVFNAEDSISLVIQYNKCSKEDTINETKLSNNSDGDKSNYIRYFRCPATVPVYVLKVLLKMKHHIPDSLRVELLYGEERLMDSWTLMEVAYIFRWPREEPMELSFQIFATRKIKRKKIAFKRKPTTIKSKAVFDIQKRTHPERENSNIINENGEPVKKVPKIVENTEESHTRPPTPPETPEQILHDDHSDNTMHSEIMSNFVLTKKTISTKHKERKEEKETLNNIDDVSFKEINRHSSENDIDSETSLEVDFSQDINMNEEDQYANSMENIKIKDSERRILNSELIDAIRHSPVKKENGKAYEKNYFSKQNRIKPKNRSHKNPSKKIDQIEGKSNAVNDIGVLDLSYHARTVRAKKIDDINSHTSCFSPSENKEITNENGDISAVSLTEGLQNVNGIDLKNNKIVHNKSIPVPLTSNKLHPDWPRTSLLPTSTVGPQATTAFRDLVTLSHAAVQLQIAMAHAQAQAQVHVQAQKLQDNVLKKLKATESLSFINGSGDTLTISPITGHQVMEKQKCTTSKSTKRGTNVISRRQKPSGILKSYTKLENQLSKKSNGTNNNKNELIPSSSQKQRSTADLSRKSSAVSTLLTNESIKSNKILAKMSTVYKSQNSGSTKLPTDLKNVTNIAEIKSTNNIKTIIPKSALSSLKIPIVNLNPCKISTNGRMEKEKKSDSTRSGDEVFKITNQKLIECLRQQHHHNKLKNSTSPKSNSQEIYLSSIKCIPEKVSNTAESINTAEPSQSFIPNPVPITAIEKSSEETSPIVTGSKVPVTIEKTSIITKESNNIPSETTSALKISNNCSFPQTSFPNSLRTTNTSIRQIPNPSRLHQQSVNRLSVGSVRPLNNGKRPFKTSTGDRLESLTRTLHEKVAASAAGVVSSLAR